jgi:ParB-like chromosome segregation protein Spo0J
LEGAGEQAPPIMLWKLKTGLFRFWIEDGDHRFLAARSIGATTIEARVMPGFIEFFQRGEFVCHRVVEESAADKGASGTFKPRRATKKSPARKRGQV